MAGSGGNPPIIPMIMIGAGAALIWAAIENKHPQDLLKQIFNNPSAAKATPAKPKPGAPGSPVYGPAIPSTKPGAAGSPVYGPAIPSVN